MKQILFATTLLAGLAAAGMARAQSPLNLDAPPVGKQADTFMIRLRAIGVIPEDNSSNIRGLGGHVSATAQAAPELDLSYFFTDHIAAEIIAATTRHELKATGTSLGDVDVGSVWALPPTLTLQYHFFPHERFSPYVGAGVNATFWYGPSPAKPTVTRVSVGSGIGAAVQAGFDYNVGGHWFLNFDVKQLFLNANAHVDALGSVTLKAHDALDPVIVGAGIGFRF